ncbi:MAG: DUF3179 domain-containing protein [Proteobacteria bacterium]|nr:DUF3179 domain-containing protein [Pseudomonadota bacterium]NOG59593.1 DUF3179 domain-containing protein [Pseudomonadota bacterium]
MKKTSFWIFMVIAQLGAFIIFKDLADISQWVIQSSREFTMFVWYNRHVISVISILALFIAMFVWFNDREICNKLLLMCLVFAFVFNYYSGMINPKLMFRAQQHEAKFVGVDAAPQYMQRSLDKAHFGPKSYATVNDIEVLVLETDQGAYAYSDYYLLQPHVAKGNSINGEEVIMTYCGLTNLGIAYSPIIAGQELDLTVMTQLKNNLVLFDKNSGAAIQQIWGTKERDPEKNKMKEWPTVRMPFISFKTLYPDGQVFINEIADLTENPVLALWDRLVRHIMMLWGVGLNWIENDKPAFPTIDFKDKRLPMKELVYTISINDDHVAYSKDFIEQQNNIINTTIGEKPIVINYNPQLDVVTAFFKNNTAPISTIDIFGITEDGTQLKRVNTLKSKLFWFIFVEFFPDTDVNRV